MRSATTWRPNAAASPAHTTDSTKQPCGSSTRSVRSEIRTAARLFILNGVVFVLIGLQLRDVVSRLDGLSLWYLVGAGALFSIVVIVLRLAWVVPGARLSSNGPGWEIC